MSRCRAFVYAGIEDFGIAPVEAMASGAPVIALGKGGILDTVNCLNNFDNNKIPNGILYKNQNSDDIFDAVNWFEDKKIWREFKPEVLMPCNKIKTYWSIEKINKKWKPIFPNYLSINSQDLPETMIDSGSFYYFNYKKIVQYNSLKNVNDLYVFELPSLNSVDVDSLEDWKELLYKFEYAKR